MYQVKTGTAEFRELIKKHLPLGPMYYPDDQLTDQSERSIAAEIMKEKDAAIPF